jgi:hypothetical protein
MTPQKLGLFIVACCLAAYVGFYLAVSKAHAAGDNLSPTATTPPQTKSRTAEPEPKATARDYQRLNACTNASIRPDIKPETQLNEAIKCAAWGKAVSHIESAKGTSRYAKTMNNHYGIMRWDKKGFRAIRKFRTTAEADAKWAQLWFDGYRKLGHKSFAARWTGEPHAVKHYSAFLSKWVPQYLKLYTSITK